MWLCLFVCFVFLFGFLEQREPWNMTKKALIIFLMLSEDYTIQDLIIPPKCTYLPHAWSLHIYGTVTSPVFKRVLVFFWFGLF